MGIIEFFLSSLLFSKMVVAGGILVSKVKKYHTTQCPCLGSSSLCHLEKLCYNMDGSYACLPCPDGYSGNGVTCTDIDEVSMTFIVLCFCHCFYSYIRLTWYGRWTPSDGKSSRCLWQGELKKHNKSLASTKFTSDISIQVVVLCFCHCFYSYIRLTWY
jgi:hypothetical protein